MNGPKTFKIGNIVESWALDIYNRTQNHQNKHGQKHGQNTRTEINWEKLRFDLIQHQWHSERNSVNSTKSQLLLNGNYHNDTASTTQHTIKFDKCTQATCTANVVQGKTAGLGVKLRVPLPSQLTQRTTAFGSYIDVSTNETTQTSRDMTWTVDTVVTTSPHSVVNARVEVKENTVSATFEGLANLKGTVVVNIFNCNNGALLTTIENDVTEIVRWYNSNNNNIQASLQEITIKEHSVFWDVKGVCEFQFGIEHEVKISPHLAYAGVNIPSRERPPSQAITTNNTSSCVVS